MSIERFFTKKVIRRRLVREATYDTEEWEDSVPPKEIYCYIQTWAGGEVGYEGARFPTHQMWCIIGEDIIKGDRIVYDSVVYEVLAIDDLDIGHNPHKQIALSML